MDPWCYVDNVFTQPLEMKKGSVMVPEGPGLGVVIDKEKVSYYRIDF
jgi:L-alanine-DL-glutamate epimerase-like enolase superfamily enzyme